MPQSRKAAEVLGFRLVQAVKLAKEHAGGETATAPPPPPPPKKKPAYPGAEPVTRFGKTAVPTKHEITCYSCSYVFPHAGRAQRLICPKCRLTLDQGDYTIDRECHTAVRTTGTVRLASSGTLKGGNLVAQNIILEGRLESGTVRAFGLLEVAGRVVLDESEFKARDLSIASGGSVHLKHKSTFRNLDLHGTLQANLEVTGVATIHPGGNLIGRIDTRHLVVEEGGGLNARVKLAETEEPEEDT